MFQFDQANLMSLFSVTEGVVLYEEGTDPYIGDMFHETPLGLLLFHWMIHNIPHWLHLVFIFSDLLTAFLLYKTAKKCMQLLVSYHLQLIEWPVNALFPIGNISALIDTVFIYKTILTIL
jgi:hypothetical protein